MSIMFRDRSKGGVTVQLHPTLVVCLLHTKFSVHTGMSADFLLGSSRAGSDMSSLAGLSGVPAFKQLHSLLLFALSFPPPHHWVQQQRKETNEQQLPWSPALTEPTGCALPCPLLSPVAEFWWGVGKEGREEKTGAGSWEQGLQADPTLMLIELIAHADLWQELPWHASELPSRITARACGHTRFDCMTHAQWPYSLCCATQPKWVLAMPPWFNPGSAQGNLFCMYHRQLSYVQYLSTGNVPVCISK